MRRADGDAWVRTAADGTYALAGPGPAVLEVAAEGHAGTLVPDQEAGAAPLQVALLPARPATQAAADPFFGAPAAPGPTAPGGDDRHARRAGHCRPHAAPCAAAAQPGPLAPPRPPDGAVVWRHVEGTAGDAFGYVQGCLVDAVSGAEAGPAAAIDLYAVPLSPRAHLPAAAPLPLLLATPEGAVGLQALHSVAWSAYQGGRRLQVAPGRSCMARARLSAALAPHVRADTALFAGDPHTGLYARRGDLVDGWLSWHGGRRTLFWAVDSLQPWTVGRPLSGLQGGCGRGRVIDACSGRRSVPHHAVVVHGVDAHGTRAWRGHADDRGRFCVALPRDAAWPGGNAEAQSLPYFLSDDDVEASAMCNPLPDGRGGRGDCRRCQPTWQGNGGPAALCTRCSLHPTPTAAAQFVDTCAAPPRSEPLRRASLVPCSFCDAAEAAACHTDGGVAPVRLGQCARLEPLLARGAGCHCTFVDAPCRPQQDHCCHVAPDRGPGRRGQAGCGPSRGDRADWRCHACTRRTGEACDVAHDTCCDAEAPDDPTVHVICDGGVCGRVAHLTAGR